MIWTHTPRTPSTLPWPGAAAPIRDWNRLQSELARLFAPQARAAQPREFPAVRVAADDEGAVLQALVPGVAPEQLEITVRGNTLSLKGERAAPTPAEGSTWHRRERRTGRFARTLTLPFDIDADQVEANFRDGLLEVKLPRVASQRPRKIDIATS